VWKREVFLQELSNINCLIFATEVKQSDVIYYFFGNLHLIVEGIISHVCMSFEGNGMS